MAAVGGLPCVACRRIRAHPGAESARPTGGIAAGGAVCGRDDSCPGGGAGAPRVILAAPVGGARHYRACGDLEGERALRAALARSAALWRWAGRPPRAAQQCSQRGQVGTAYVAAASSSPAGQPGAGALCEVRSYLPDCGCVGAVPCAAASALRASPYNRPVGPGWSGPAWVGARVASLALQARSL